MNMPTYPADLMKLREQLLEQNKKIDGFTTNDKNIDNIVIELMKNPGKRRALDRKLALVRFARKIKIALGGMDLLFQAMKFVLGKKPLTGQLRSIIMGIGYQCQLGCEQCSCALMYDPMKKRLSLDEYKEVIDQAVDLGAFVFNITGGDPLLYKDETLELTRYISDNKCHVHICTNGLLASEALLKQLKNYGLKSIEMGLDSADRHTHDSNRRPGSYDRIMEVIDICHKIGVGVLLNTIFTKEKIRNGDILNLIALARRKKAWLIFTSPCLTGRWADNIDIILSDIDRMFLKYCLRNHHCLTDMCNNVVGWGCPAGNEKLGINPYGGVAPCALIEKEYGNIRELSLKEIREKILADPFYTRKAPGCLASAYDVDFYIIHKLGSSDRPQYNNKSNSPIA